MRASACALPPRPTGDRICARSPHSYVTSRRGVGSLSGRKTATTVVGLQWPEGLAVADLIRACKPTPKTKRQVSLRNALADGGAQVPRASGLAKRPENFTVNHGGHEVVSPLRASGAIVSKRQ